MGTNYYARIIPTKERKEHLKKLIDTDDFGTIVEEIAKTYERYGNNAYEEPTGGVVHLGKSSYGWKFLWNPNFYVLRNGHTVLEDVGEGAQRVVYIEDPDTYHTLYPLTKKGIKDFIDRPDVKVFDEYGEEQDKDEFFKYALEFVTRVDEDGNTVEAYDDKTYTLEEASAFEKSYGRFDTPTIKGLRNAGYEIDAKYNYDFYSDGLRFSTSNDFS